MIYWIVDADRVCARRHGRGTGPVLLVPGLTTGRATGRNLPIMRRTHWRPLVEGEPLRAALCGFDPAASGTSTWMSDPVILPVDCGGCRAVLYRPGIVMLDEQAAWEAWRESVKRGHVRYRPGPEDPCVCLVD